jgi:hypothetical protein
VRVGDHRRGAVGQHRLFKGRAAEHGAFNVDVPIHKPRADIPALQVQLSLAGIVSHAKDDPLTDGYISLLDLVCEHIDDPGIFQHKLCPHVTLCCQDLLLQGFHFHKGPLVLLLLLKTCVLLPEILFWVYMAIQPKAFATELARMMAAKMGHSQRIIKLNTGLRRKR